MNELGREKLRAAALAGVKQIYGDYEDDGGYCAVGLLGYWQMTRAEEELDLELEERIAEQYGLTGTNRACPLCPSQEAGPFADEVTLLIHLNDHHELDFLKLAAIMP